MTEGELSINVTISIGATMARKDDTLEKLLKRADELLYESKRNGRNRVTFG
ncbi:MAG TPA: diguanylate cyclase [Thermotogota bacterium]|nr:diguanylate cyclase [Thermotogota bacterium]